MKKIIFYINSLASGGAERAISNTASYFAEHEWNVILLTSFRTDNEYPYSDKICRISIEEEQVQQSVFRRNLNRVKAIRDICRKQQVDVIVSFMREPNFRALIATVGLRTKTVVSIRSDPKYEYQGVVGKIIKCIIISRADGAVFQTNEARAYFGKKLQNKATIIYNMISPDFFNTDYIDGTDVVTVGRISAEKNQMLLIKAFKILCTKRQNERLILYGKKDKDLGLESLIDRLGIQDAVFLGGQRKDIPRILSKAKLFVLSSDYEGLPNALMEAMAVGVPCISTDCPCGGPRELFGDELKDMLVPVGDVEALADKMIELLSDDEKRLHVGANMRKRAKMFRADVIGEQWVAYIEQVMRQKK